MRIRSLGTLIGHWEHYPDTGNTGVLFITTLKIRTIANRNKKNERMQRNQTMVWGPP